MRRSILAAGLASIVVAASCTFINVTLPGEGGSGGGTSSSGSGTGGAASASSSTSSTSGMAGASSASSSVSSSGDAGCCDCDGDLHNSKLPGCGGDDCDDTDIRVFPGQTMFFDTKNNDGGYDFDCNGVPEKDPTIDVAGKCGLACLTDESAPHYLDASSPMCGEAGEWGTCNTGTPCVKGVIDGALPMRCR